MYAYNLYANMNWKSKLQGNEKPAENVISRWRASINIPECENSRLERYYITCTMFMRFRGPLHLNVHLGLTSIYQLLGGSSELNTEGDVKVYWNWGNCRSQFPVLSDCEKWYETHIIIFLGVPLNDWATVVTNDFGIIWIKNRFFTLR